MIISGRHCPCWRHHVEMVSTGAGLPLIPCPCLAQILWRQYGTRYGSESPWDDSSSSYPVGGRLVRTQPCGGLWHGTEKSLSFLVVLEIWYLHEGPGRVCWVLLQVQAQWRILVPVKVQLMCRPWGQTCPQEVPPNSATSLKKWHFHRRSHPGGLPTKDLPEYLISWKVCLLPLIKRCFLF